MARATYTCPSCNARTIEVTGRNRADAESRAKWARDHDRVCRSCYEQRIAVERQAQAQTARDTAAADHLPALTGVSDKQIAYGETVRARVRAQRASLESEMMDDIARFVRTARKHGLASADEAAAAEEEARDAFAAICVEMDRETEARYWLDLPDGILERMMRDAGTRGYLPVFTAIKARLTDAGWEAW